MTWTAEDKAKIKPRWEAGESASSLAAAFRCTRNAISGLVNRNGWVTPNKHLAPGLRKPKMRAVVNLYKALSRASSPVPQPPLEPDTEPTIEDLAIPAEQRRSIQQLTKHTCHWPVGSGADLFFCGAAPMEDKPYCPGHYRRSILPRYTTKPHSFSLQKLSVG